MTDEPVTPFHIDGPAVVSFSGGRTSAYMLRRILDAHGGTLPVDVHVLFANTGKERLETLQFVHEIELRWDVPIHWLEYRRQNGVSYVEEMTYFTASRNGEPFSAFIDSRGLPNPAFRSCTQELKIRPMRDWMRGRGYDHWTNVVGIRADEPRRVAKMRQAGETRKERWDVALPLADANVSEVDVMAFWAAQPFDLQIGQFEGNCDLCFLKGYAKLKNIVRDRPDLAVWWAEQEQRVGGTFRNDRPSYAAMLAQPDLFTHADDLIECYCTD